MKRILWLSIAGSVCLAGLVCAQAPRSASQNINLRNLDHYARVTETPYEMHDSTSAFCQAPEWVAKSPHEPAAPDKAYCHVYVSKEAKEILVRGHDTYPVGSIIVKSKLLTADSKKPVLYTAMIKMDEGYDSQHGDWRYSVIDGKTLRQIASGRIDSCIDCHDQYRETDFVTRTYLRK